MFEGIENKLENLANILDNASNYRFTRGQINKGIATGLVVSIVGHERHQEVDHIKQLLDNAVKPWTETIDIIPPQDGNFKDPTFIQQLEATKSYQSTKEIFQNQITKLVETTANEPQDFSIVDHVAAFNDENIIVSMALLYNGESEKAQQATGNPPKDTLILLNPENPDLATLLRPQPDNGTVPVLATAQFQGENYPVVLWVPPTGESAPIYILVNKDGQWVPELLVDNSNLYAEKNLSLVYAKEASVWTWETLETNVQENEVIVFNQSTPLEVRGSLTNGVITKIPGKEGHKFLLIIGTEIDNLQIKGVNPVRLKEHLNAANTDLIKHSRVEFRKWEHGVDEGDIELLNNNNRILITRPEVQTISNNSFITYKLYVNEKALQSYEENVWPGLAGVLTDFTTILLGMPLNAGVGAWEQVDEQQMEAGLHELSIQVGKKVYGEMSGEEIMQKDPNYENFKKEWDFIDVVRE